MSHNLESEHPSRSRPLWKFVAAAVTAFSLAWVLWLLAKVWPELAAHSVEIRLPLLLFGLALSLLASYVTFEAFAALVRILQISNLPRRELAHLYFIAQLLKHLPGRVWGIGYQWAAGRSAGSLGDWVLVNLGHALLATFFALWSAWVALGFSSGAKWGLLATVGGAITYVAGWLVASSSRLWRWLAWLPVRIETQARGLLDVLLRTPVSTRVWIFFLFLASSLFYYASWFLYGMSYPPLGAGGGVQLCALYMLAWFVGYISLVTPSGLGVRELIFVWLAKDFPGDAVALMAVIGRGSLLSVDLVMGLIFARFVPRKS